MAPLLLVVGQRIRRTGRSAGALGRPVIHAYAKVRLNDAAATLDTLPVGAAVTLAGTRSGDVLTATKLLAHTTTSG